MSRSRYFNFNLPRWNWTFATPVSGTVTVAVGHAKDMLKGALHIPKEIKNREFEIRIEVPSIEAQQAESAQLIALGITNVPEIDQVERHSQNPEIKVRDYAYPASLAPPCPPSAYTPGPYQRVDLIEYLVKWDLFHSDAQAELGLKDIPITPYMIYRLLDAGWIAQEECRKEELIATEKYRLLREKMVQPCEIRYYWHGQEYGIGAPDREERIANLFTLWSVNCVKTRKYTAPPRLPAYLRPKGRGAQLFSSSNNEMLVRVKDLDNVARKMDPNMPESLLFVPRPLPTPASATTARLDNARGDAPIRPAFPTAPALAKTPRSRPRAQAQVSTSTARKPSPLSREVFAAPEASDDAMSSSSSTPTASVTRTKTYLNLPPYPPVRFDSSSSTTVGGTGPSSSTASSTATANLPPFVPPRHVWTSASTSQPQGFGTTSTINGSAGTSVLGALGSGGGGPRPLSRQPRMQILGSACTTPAPSPFSQFAGGGSSLSMAPPPPAMAGVKRGRIEELPDDYEGSGGEPGVKVSTGKQGTAVVTSSEAGSESSRPQKRARISDTQPADVASTSSDIPAPSQLTHSERVTGPVEAPRDVSMVPSGSSPSSGSGSGSGSHDVNPVAPSSTSTSPKRKRQQTSTEEGEEKNEESKKEERSSKKAKVNPSLPAPSMRTRRSGKS